MTTRVTTDVLDDQVVAGLTAVTIASGDYVMISDTSDGSKKKKALVSDIVALVPVNGVWGHLGGCGIANGTDTVNDINVSAGRCADSTNTVSITVAAMAGKQLDVGWTPGAAAGMRNSGAAIANTTYHIYVVAKADGTQDIYAHTSLVVATVITALQAESGGASYLYARRIASIIRSGATILQFSQAGDWFTLNDIVVNYSAAPVAAATSLTLTTPPSVRALFRAELRGNNLNNRTAFTESTQTAVTPGTGNASLGVSSDQNVATGGANAGHFQMLVDASSQIKHNSVSTGGTLYVNTYGWIDTRGRD